VRSSTFLVFFGGFVSLLIPANVFWPYFAGIAVSGIGLGAAKQDLWQARGPDKLIILGRLFYAIPLAVFAAEHFTSTKAIALIVPRWIPEPVFWTYFVGTALVAAALSIVTKQQARLGAALLGAMLFLFVLLIHIPRVIHNPRDRISWAVALRDLAFSGGALAFAGSLFRAPYTRAAQLLITAARYLVAVACLFFGFEQFRHPDFVPGVPLGKATPAWIPGHIFWGYFSAVVIFAAGLCLFANVKTRLAATCLGAMVFVLVVFVYLPMLAVELSDIGNGLNFIADTLMFSGAALLLAEAMPKESPTPA
jgi:uncharacterized membrane protein YphA (DoxX/SURF4 family)